MKPLLCLLLATVTAHAELRVPASTAYVEPNPRGAQVGNSGIREWNDSKAAICWFGEIKQPGKLTAKVLCRLPKGETTHLELKAGDQAHKAVATGSGESQTVDFGEFTVPQAGYLKVELTAPESREKRPELEALVLDGDAAREAHFNVEPRRNAASVHLRYSPPAGKPVTLFYNEVTAVEDPVHTFYMACGFSRGYFGMQINSPTERRIIFSVWDSGAGQNAKDRSEVAAEDHVSLLAKGEGVVASGFGNEGTGGHSHLVYPWKTGQPQRFLLAAAPEGTHTDYSGYWFNPEKHEWMLIASFRAPKDGGALRSLYSFSENFVGDNGQLRRKALFGPGWVRTADGEWHELLDASFSHDPTGKTARLDRFMGVEHGRFFLSQGGFIPGSTKYGESFTRPSAGKPPTDLPPLPGATPAAAAR